MDLKSLDNYWTEHWKSKRIFKIRNDSLLLKSVIINPKVNEENAQNLIINDIYARYLRKKGFNVINAYYLDEYAKEKYLDKYGLSYDNDNIFYFDDNLIYGFKKEVIDKIKKSVYYQNINNEIDLLKFYPKLLKKEFLDIKEGLELSIEIKDALASIKVFLEDYHLLYGASFISIPYNNLITKDIISYDELEAFQEFIEDSSSNELELFSGRYAILPFINKEIPILISKRVADIHLGIPTFNIEDDLICDNFDLEKTVIMENGFMVNSKMLNGLNQDEAKEEMAKALLSVSGCRKVIKYPIEKLKIEDIDFQKYLMQFIPLFYFDDYILNETEQLEQINKYDALNFLSLYETNKNDYIIYEFLSEVLFSKDFITKIHIINKNKNQILDSIDITRISHILKHPNLEAINKFLGYIWKCGFYVVDENVELDLLFKRMMQKGDYYYENFDFDNLLNIINLFLNEVLKQKKISSKQMLGLLKLLNPLCPVITEELFKTLFNGYETLAFEDL